MSQQMRMVLRPMLLGLLLVLSLLIINSCAHLEKETGVSVYAVSVEQLEQVRQVLKINKCPEGTTAAILAFELAHGGATVTVRCQ